MSLEIHCVICQELVPEDRVKRGAVTCSQEHNRLLKNGRRNLKAGTSCRLCGRRIRKPRMESESTQQPTLEIGGCASGAQATQ